MRRALNGALVAITLPVLLLTLAIGERVRCGLGRRTAARGVRVLARGIGVRFDVVGADRLEAHGSYVLVPNHQSPLDIPAMFLACPGARFVAASELFANPILRPALRAMGTVRVDRREQRLAVQQIASAAASDEPLRLVVFAEGGLVAVDEQARFKTGAFVLAIDAGATVVPVAIHGSGAALPKGGLLGVRGGRITVELLEPISTEGLTRADRKALRTQTQDAVRTALAGSAP